MKRQKNYHYGAPPTNRRISFTGSEKLPPDALKRNVN